jgi:hypothetical protein
MNDGRRGVEQEYLYESTIRLLLVEERSVVLV